jgi:hypothetical protein
MRGRGRCDREGGCERERVIWKMVMKRHAYGRGRKEGTRRVGGKGARGFDG